ncbi:MAG: hypothetical protein KIG60_09695 [Caryophanon sp.]|nr:hypothetical protein [Caryophanon sp.]
MQWRQVEIQQMIQQPDLLFFQYCQQHFRVNKGVFHTIDCQLYEMGFEKVKQRRYIMVQFLRYAQHRAEQSGKYMKFGHGNLRKVIDEFLAQYEQFALSL